LSVGRVIMPLMGISLVYMALIPNVFYVAH